MIFHYFFTIPTIPCNKWADLDRIVKLVTQDEAIQHLLGVSENSGTPKSSILIGFSIINHPFWGTLFWKPLSTNPFKQGIHGTIFRVRPGIFQPWLKHEQGHKWRHGTTQFRQKDPGAEVCRKFEGPKITQLWFAHKMSHFDTSNSQHFSEAISDLWHKFIWNWERLCR